MPTLTTNSNTASAGVSIGKDFLVAVAGTFDGATVAVQYTSNGTYHTFQSGETGSFTAAGERQTPSPAAPVIATAPTRLAA